MSTSVEEFKQAFASKVTEDDLTAHHQSFDNAMKRIDSAIVQLGPTAAAGRFRAAQETLAKRYEEAKKKTDLPKAEIATKLNEIIGQAEAVLVKVNAASKEAGWSISPDGVPGQVAPAYAGTGTPDLFKIDPKFFDELEKENQQKQAKKLKDAQSALDQAKKWLTGQPKEDLRKLTYPAILAAMKEKYPALADLPKPKQLMDAVDKILTDNGYLMEKGFLGDPSKLAMDKIIATYIAALPANIKPVLSDGGITLLMTGAASVVSAAADGKSSDKEPDKFEFKNKNYVIGIASDVWKALDPGSRAKWKGLNDEATTLQKIDEALTSLKKEWASEKDGTSRKIELEARIKDMEANFKGRWETLQKSINAQAKLTTDSFTATLEQAKKSSKDEKAGAELKIKFDEMSAGFKAFANTPDLKTALEMTGSSEKISAKIEAELIKSGTVITVNYEKSLQEVKEQLDLQIKNGDNKVAAKLSKEAAKLEEQVKKLNDAKRKDIKEVEALEKGLETLKLEVTAEFKAGNFKLIGGGKVTSDGEAGGKVRVDLMLDEGFRFLGEGQKVSFVADVSNKGYQFALMFSVGEMPDLKDVDKANKEADEKIKQLYDLVKDTRIRSMDDAKKIEAAFTEVMKPLKKSVEAMKKQDKKKMAVELGLTVTGEFSNNGHMPPPVAGVGLKIVF